MATYSWVFILGAGFGVPDLAHTLLHPEHENKKKDGDRLKMVD